MGWTSTHRNSGEMIKTFFCKEFGVGVVDCALVNMTEAYIAYRTKTGEIIGIVVLVRFGGGYYNISYKDMDETMLPYYYNCPERILKRLSPTTNENALEWRNRCWEKINNKKNKPIIRNGDTLIFNEPVSFSNGRNEKTFVAVNVKKLIFSDVNNWYLFRLTRKMLNNPTSYTHRQNIGEKILDKPV